MDYELLGIRAKHTHSYETAPVYIRFRNIGTTEGSAFAEVFLNGTSHSSKYVTDLTGDGPGKDVLWVTYGGVGTYTLEVRLTSDTGTDILTKTVIIRK